MSLSHFTDEEIEALKLSNLARLHSQHMRQPGFQLRQSSCLSANPDPADLLYQNE